MGWNNRTEAMWMRIKCGFRCVWLCVCVHICQTENSFSKRNRASVHEHIQVAVCLHVHENVSRDCAAANLPYRPHSNTHSHTCCDGCCAPAELSSRPQLPLCHYAIWQLQMVWELHTRVLLFHPAGPRLSRGWGSVATGEGPQWCNVTKYCTSTNLMCFYFTWVFPFCNTLCFYFTTSLRQIL